MNDLRTDQPRARGGPVTAGERSTDLTARLRSFADAGVMTADAEATLRAAANRLVELEAENARLQEQWTNFLGDQHMLVKSGQAVTADGVVCDLERRTVDSWLTDTYRLRPVVDLPEGGTS